MKQFFLYSFLLAVYISACVKQNTPETPANDPVDTTAQVKFSGVFINGPYGRVSGTVKVKLSADQVYSLVLQDMNITNGPDLHVYLSREVQPVNFIDLGKLKSVSGTQVYAIQGSPDFVQYKYALVHCQQFNHLFGSAELKP
jgi:hypothetical protein